jgi:hypothetical protein
MTFSLPISNAKEMHMNATALITNGKPQRKQLSDQLDRFDEQMARADSILDALADGLNQAVGDAARIGTREAVTSAVIELLTNVDLRTALHKATAPPAEVKPTFWQRIKARVHHAKTRVKEAAARITHVVSEKVAAVKAAATSAASPARLVWRLRKAALVGLGVGLVVAGISYAATHGVAAALSGLGAATTALAIQAGVWVRRTVRRLALA